MNADATGGAFTKTFETLMIVSADAVSPSQCSVILNLRAAPLAGTLGAENVGVDDVGLLSVTEIPGTVLLSKVQRKFRLPFFGVESLPLSVTSVGEPPVVSG